MPDTSYSHSQLSLLSLPKFLMAFSRALLLSLFASFLLLTLLQSHHAIAAETSADPVTQKASINCAGACQYRCSKSWKPKMCIKMCTGCCNKCACVPPGPTASRDVCRCYAELKNSKTGALKCP